MSGGPTPCCWAQPGVPEAGLREARRRTRVSTRRAPTRAGARAGRMSGTDDPVARGKRRRWRVSPAASVPRDQRLWLTAGGALTSHLARSIARMDTVERAGTPACQVTVQVLKERRENPWADEAPLLGTPARGMAWVREVVLAIDDIPCVVAHSVTGLAHSRGIWRAMRTLRTRPLAILLYRDPMVRRSMLTSRVVPLAGGMRARGSDPVLRLYAGQRMRIAARVGNVGEAREAHRSGADSLLEMPADVRMPLVARRSVFERHGAPLIITECFLPAFWTLLDRTDGR